MGKYITDYFLYRWRFILGYSVIGLAIIGLLLVVGLYVPGGLSADERQSVVTSSALSLSLDSFSPESIINLPYHLLQKFSLFIFGVSPLSIKLPSLILGVLSAAGMLILLQTWFRRNVALITTILVITTGQFLFVAQSGTPSILYIFWSVWLLLAAMMVSRQAKWNTFWKIVLFAVAALSLYTPLSVYILLALVSAVVLHPHLRYLMRRLPKPKLAIGALCALVLAAPLIYAIVQSPSVGIKLLGIPANWPDLMANAMQLVHQYFDFASPSHGELMTPIYGLGAVLLIILGIFRLFTTKYTARSYVITAWIVLLLPILVINPDFVSITFVPVVLLMGMGIGILLSRWYRLFPQNPYARIAGLIPLSVLIGGMVFSGLDRYMYGYHYDPQTSTQFSQDLRLLNSQLNAKNRPQTTLVTSDEEAPFYTVVADHATNLAVTTSLPQAPASQTIITHDADKMLPVESLQQIVTDGNSHDADRLYIYKTDQK